mmetsp:Transcript_36837/g.42012  ORF Transcript_36837/g.42012 Transcript_36837/m.42012 type:complete len:102 (+) Transcript_36837:443-748(+)
MDFAMQQKKDEKERREKEKAAREGLISHRATSTEYRKAAQRKAETEVERDHRMDAQKNLASFRNADKDLEFQKALDNRKKANFDKLKKKEASEHLSGFRSP